MTVDLTGKHYGGLTVLSRNGKDRYSRLMWLCQCECGNRVTVRSNNLRTGNSKSCGGCRKPSKTRIDMTGAQSGRLKVMGFSRREKGRAYWKCQCECSKVVDVWGSSLRSGHTQSCGCLIPDRIREAYERRLIAYGVKRSRRKIRRTPIDHLWSEFIKRANGRMCIACGGVGETLHAHHLDSYQTFKDRRLAADNGVSLCVPCHKTFHQQYGNVNNTAEQFHEFIGAPTVDRDLFSDRQYDSPPIIYPPLGEPDGDAIMMCLKRYANKGGIEDLKKARWYLNKVIEYLEKKGKDNASV